MSRWTTWTWSAAWYGKAGGCDRVIGEMRCRFCSWLCDRFCSPDVRKIISSRASYEWEEGFAADWEPEEADDAVRNGWHEAAALKDRDPAAALAIHVKLAEGGSVFSMLKAGYYYSAGCGTEKDLPAAEEFYRRALCAGSWRATIRYADLLFKRGAHDEWRATLSDGVQKGFIPSFFWLAWYSYKLSPKGRTAREVRYLLETAADAGHPSARLTLARWHASGKFGVREIVRGVRMIRAISFE